MMWPWTRQNYVTRETAAQMVEVAVEEAADLFGKEDAQYIMLGSKPGDLSETERKQIVNYSRIYGRRDALGTHIIRLWQNYGIGTGLNWASEDKFISTKLGALWSLEKNKIIFSSRGQREVVRTLLTDGELFLIVFPGKPSVWRIVDSMEIADIATDPEDAYTERYYKRQWNGQTKVYRNILNEKSDPGVWSNQGTVEINEVDNTAFIFHVALDTMKGRGYPLLIASLEWILGHRQFMRSRIAIQQELARLARKVKIKGGPTAVSAESARLAAQRAARRAQTDTPTMAGTRVENEASTMESMDMETGASAAQTDGAMILQMAGIGSSIFTHYLGAGEAFRLATATAMEAPMKITFMSFQEIIRSIYETIFDFELRDLGKKKDGKALYTLEIPDIVTMDIPNSVNSAATLTTAMPGLSDSDEFQRTTLLRAGYRNADKIVEDLSLHSPSAPPVPEIPDVKQPDNVTPKNQAEPSKKTEALPPSEANDLMVSLLERIARAREAHETGAHNGGCGNH